MNIGQLTKKLRKNRSLKQGAVAKELGISQTYLSQLEKGARNPSSGMIDKLAMFYQIPAPVMGWLTMTEDLVPENKRESFKQIKPAMDALVEEFFRISK